MDYKRVTLLCGHYGSGKTNISVNMAADLASKKSNVVIADLDIVNPYFRSVDSKGELSKMGVKTICSEYANTNIDAPALPQEMYAIVDDLSINAIIDVGGDERGALALGRIADKIREENNYDMFLVINKYRPLTPDAKSVIEVMEEIENAGHLKFTGIINCSNLGEETTPEVVLSSMDFARKVSEESGLKIVATAVEESLIQELNGKIENLFPLKLQEKII